MKSEFELEAIAAEKLEEYMMASEWSNVDEGVIALQRMIAIVVYTHNLMKAYESS